MNQNPSPNLVEAIRLVNAIVIGRLGTWSSWLTGGHNAINRARILSYLLGVRTPQSKAGITALTEELYDQCGIPKGCPAHRDHDFTIYALGVLNNPELMKRIRP